MKLQSRTVSRGPLSLIGVSLNLGLPRSVWPIGVEVTPLLSDRDESPARGRSSESQSESEVYEQQDASDLDLECPADSFEVLDTSDASDDNEDNDLSLIHI